jgi:uncharacterized protein YbaR (Trm112 family)
MAVSPDLLEILRCPKCKGELELAPAGDALSCNSCRLRYPIEDDIPVMMEEEATRF